MLPTFPNPAFNRIDHIIYSTSTSLLLTPKFISISFLKNADTDMYILTLFFPLSLSDFRYFFSFSSLYPGAFFFLLFFYIISPCIFIFISFFVFRFHDFTKIGEILHFFFLHFA